MRSQSCDAQLVKAEAEYNLCQFEHALVLYHRGKVIKWCLDFFFLINNELGSVLNFNT